jgi:hypothetical protein
LELAGTSPQCPFGTEQDSAWDRQGSADQQYLPSTFLVVTLLMLRQWESL